MESKVDVAIQKNDFGGLTAIFSGSGPDSWSSLGQGEQRQLSAYFIKAAVASPTFLPKALSSSNDGVVAAMETALKHLPPTVENAADSVLRQKLFEHLIEKDEYSRAAAVLGGMRMDEAEGSVYHMTAAERCDVYVRIAECYLEEDEIVEADAAVNRAGTVVESIENPDQQMPLILRYKSTYARVLDANRKFLQAASRYHDLSRSSTELIDADDLLQMLGRSITCAILAPSGPQRQRVLGLVFKDERLAKLDELPGYSTHASILRKMYMNHILRHDTELEKFLTSLQPHQKALMGDGLTIVERAVIEHNMVAVSKVYSSIRITELGKICGVQTGRAEQIASKMIGSGALQGELDQVDGILSFESSQGGSASSASSSSLLQWDDAITSFCTQLNRVTDAIRS